MDQDNQSVPLENEMSSVDPAAEAPVIACSLTAVQLQRQRNDLLPRLFERAERVTDLATGKRLEFTSSPDLLADITKIIERERVCCCFLRFALAIEPSAGPVTLDITGPAGTREMLQRL